MTFRDDGDLIFIAYISCLAQCYGKDTDEERNGFMVKETARKKEKNRKGGRIGGETIE